MRQQNFSVQVFLLHNLCLHTPLLRSEGLPMSWNFQQTHPVIKYDNWCQSSLDFPDLNPNSDDIM